MSDEQLTAADLLRMSQIIELRWLAQRLDVEARAAPRRQYLRAIAAAMKREIATERERRAKQVDNINLACR